MRTTGLSIKSVSFHSHSSFLNVFVFPRTTLVFDNDADEDPEAVL